MDGPLASFVRIWEANACRQIFVLKASVPRVPTTTNVIPTMTVSRDDVMDGSTNIACPKNQMGLFVMKTLIVSRADARTHHGEDGGVDRIWM